MSATKIIALLALVAALALVGCGGDQSKPDQSAEARPERSEDAMPERSPEVAQEALEEEHAAGVSPVPFNPCRGKLSPRGGGTVMVPLITSDYMDEGKPALVYEGCKAIKEFSCAAGRELAIFAEASPGEKIRCLDFAAVKLTEGGRSNAPAETPEAEDEAACEANGGRIVGGACVKPGRVSTSSCKGWQISEGYMCHGSREQMEQEIAIANAEDSP